MFVKVQAAVVARMLGVQNAAFLHKTLLKEWPSNTWAALKLAQQGDNMLHHASNDAWLAASIAASKQGVLVVACWPGRVKGAEPSSSRLIRLSSKNQVIVWGFVSQELDAL